MIFCLNSLCFLQIYMHIDSKVTAKYWDTWHHKNLHDWNLCNCQNIKKENGSNYLILRAIESNFTWERFLSQAFIHSENHKAMTSAFPVDTGHKLSAHKTFRRRPRLLLNVLYTFNLRPLSTGLLIVVMTGQNLKLICRAISRFLEYPSWANKIDNW